MPYGFDESSEDEDLKRAIALSMEDPGLLPTSASGERVVIDLSSDEDTDDLDRVVPKQKPSNRTSRSITSEHPLASSSNAPSHLTSSSDNVTLSSKAHEDSTTVVKSLQITSSKNQTGQSATKKEDQHTEEVFKPSKPGKGEPVITGLVGLDRKKMEEERLARATKRKAPPSPSSIRRESAPNGSETPQSSSASLPDISDRQPSKRAMLSSDSKIPDRRKLLDDVGPKDDKSLPGNKLMNAEPATLADIEGDIFNSKTAVKAGEMQSQIVQDVQSFKQQQTRLHPGVQYPNGTIKKTWAYGFPRSNDIKLEEVLQKNDLDLAVLSAFQWDDEWVLSKFDLKRTKLIFVVQAKSTEQKDLMKRNAPPGVRFCFPPMDGQINLMHSKLQLLAHPSHLRVAVPTANLVPYDWGETGVMENTVFIIDLPRLPNNQTIPVEQLTPFGRELQRFLTAMTMDSKIINSILKFDFSQTMNLAFVHTIGGSHSGDDWKTTGYPGLGSAIRQLGLSSSAALNVNIVVNAFIKAIYLAAKGDDGLTELNWRTRGPAAEKESTPEERLLLMQIEEGFRIFFPTRETVANSKGGIGAGGTICLQQQWYDRSDFPKELFRDCISKRPGLLMHSKLIFTAPADLNSTGRRDTGWAYVGSANLSESAWGRLIKDRRTKMPKLNCRNWECGVVISLRDFTPARSLGSATPASTPPRVVQEHDLDPVFSGVVPVPMVTPGVEYNGKRPWFFMED